MARLVGVRQVWTFFLSYAAAMALVIAGPITAAGMLKNHPHPATGYALGAVAIGAGSLIPVVLLIVWMYRRSDEYERQGILLVTSIAFAIALVAMAALDLLVDTDLLQGWVWAPRWWTIVACWMISLLGVRVIRNRGA